LVARFSVIGDALLDTMYAPFPSVVPATRLVRALGSHDLLRFARFAALPVRRLGEEHFAGDPARRLLAGAALHADVGPETPPSGLLGWLLCCLGQHYGFPVPQGGASAITAALVRRLRASGGQVLCNTPVDGIAIEHGRARGVTVAGQRVPARRAVLADVTAPLLFDDLVGHHHLPDPFVADLRRFHWDDATVKVDWTLDGPIPWTAAGARDAGTVHVAEGVDALTLSSSQIARRLIPDRPLLICGQYHHTDPSRQPRGWETAWCYTHVPRAPIADAAGAIGTTWSADDVEGFAERIERQIEEMAPGFRTSIRARHVTVPSDFDADNPSMSLGGLNGGTAQIHQQLAFRPVPSLRGARTPVPGLLLASSSAHPGGGVHGAPGANAARAALGWGRWKRSWSPVLG
jgi:phytoene dehydrogenase-like protein